MNKKNLSVVMAGAMLATSVAPVLADTTTETTKKDYEVNNSNRGLLIKELRTLMNSKTFSNLKENDGVDGKDLAGKSVYYVTASYETEYNHNVKYDSKYENLLTELNKTASELNIELSNVNFSTIHNNVVANANKFVKVGENSLYILEAKWNSTDSKFETKVSLKSNLLFRDADSMDKAVQDAATGTVFHVYDEGHVDKTIDGVTYTYAKGIEPELFEETDLQYMENWFAGKIPGTSAEAAKEAAPYVYAVDYDEDTKVLTVKTRVVKDGHTEDHRVVYTYKVGDPIIDLTQAVDSKGNVLSKNDVNNNADIAGFAIRDNTDANVKDLEEKLLYNIEITDVSNVYETTLPELYDGLFLTDKGQELLDTMKEYDANGDFATRTVETKTDKNGLYYVEIEFKKEIANGKTENYLVRVTSNNKDQMDIFAKGISADTTSGHSTLVRNFPVEVLAGDNRYETAVKVAKENASIRTVAENGNIVLVNGNSLVDGLAAAPLAASVQNKGMNPAYGSDNYVAPILLTDANGIPKATKDYMKEVIAHQQVGALDKVTVYLVGGEAVISKAVENDLKEIGFRVVRAGGEDREATSLAVAELMKKDGNAEAVASDEAFVVGANGEADAMSIASVAAKNATPIIVESVHGIKEDTINFLKGYKNTPNYEAKDVTIIGGKTAVSEATEQELKDAKLSVHRVEGANRKATNAKVMELYYNNGEIHRYVVSKDGMNNKSELIDALTATSLAVKDNAPIVLGTNSLSKEQVNQMELKAREEGVYVYQVGHGVARDVVKTIAEKIGLAVR